MRSERQEIARRRQQLRDLLRSLSQEPLMRGSVVERLRKCGRPNCRCAKDRDARHGGRFLTVQIDGRTQALHLRPADEAYVRDAIATYQRVWELIGDLTRCELAELRRQVRERRRRKRASA